MLLMNHAMQQRVILKILAEGDLCVHLGVKGLRRCEENGSDVTVVPPPPPIEDWMFSFNPVGASH